MTTTEKVTKQGHILWVTLLKGVLLVVLGVWMLSMPQESFEGLAFLIGLITLIGGLIETAYSYYSRKKHGAWGWNLSGGIMDIILGIFLMVNPMAILALIAIFISFWLLFFSVLIIRKSIILKRLGRKSWKGSLAFGLVLLLIGIVLIWHPQVVGITLLFWLAFSFITLGLFRIILAFQARNFMKKS
ncbi:MAG: DUF308 domain-containing protein [Bacteroidota bacterium]